MEIFAFWARDWRSLLLRPRAHRHPGQLYDPFGRRVQKTIGSTTTGFLYDGPNYVQEQNSDGTWIATELTGGVDEVFARMTSAGIHGADLRR